MACPFFLPTEKLVNATWLHAGRLPLGCGWNGQCTAPGHEGEIPSSEELREFCNLGYAEDCGRLPRERVWDSVRFGARVVSEGNGTHGCIQVRYVCERGHRPAEHGVLAFDPADARWVERHRDERVQRMAECFLESYVEKRKHREVMEAAS
ncbi:MAG TPA: hypothetical protein VNX26_13375 [Candidatus Acidoferrum sp.]|nr:hypothetical protein [Candidatus Acidoferrum sp.]